MVIDIYIYGCNCYIYKYNTNIFFLNGIKLQVESESKIQNTSSILIKTIEFSSFEVTNIITTNRILIRNIFSSQDDTNNTSGLIQFAKMVVAE